MIHLFKYINSIPCRLTIKHYQMFGDFSSGFVDNSLNHVESWQTLRESHPHFSISQDRDEWVKVSELKFIKDGQDKGLIQRAEEIVCFLRQEGIETLFSVGVGGAGLEYQIKKMMPEISIICSEYEPKTVDRLKRVFLEADEILRFDILNGDWSEIKNKYLVNNKSAVLMYRLDAGFSNQEWRKIFESMSNACVTNVIYIPTTTLTLLSIWNRKSRELKWLLSRMPVSFAGYLRTKKSFKCFWKSIYSERDVVFGGLISFYLEKNDIAKH